MISSVGRETLHVNPILRLNDETLCLLESYFDIQTFIDSSDVFRLNFVKIKSFINLTLRNLKKFTGKGGGH